MHVVLGPRVKIIILNILSESKRHELKFSLKIAFMLLTIILNGNIFLVIRKKGDRARGPLSANVVLVPRIIQAARKVLVNTDNLTIFYLFFIILDISKLQSC